MKSSIQIKKIGQNVISVEHQQIKNLVERIDDNFVSAVQRQARAVCVGQCCISIRTKTNDRTVRGERQIVIDKQIRD